MNFEAALDAFAFGDALPEAEVRWVVDNWAQTAEPCRALLQGFVNGRDLTERTQLALFAILHILAEKADTASFHDICFLMEDAETADLILGDMLQISGPSILISTFDGNAALLNQLIESEETDELLRADALLALAYLTRTGVIPESQTYGYLASLPARLAAEPESFVWFGWVRAVAALGFAGLAGQAEALFRRGAIAPDVMTLEDFWADVRESQADPKGMSSPAWDGIGPVESALEMLAAAGDDPEEDPEPQIPEPLRNPLREIGRNDPCPCGSGKKFKKCCLAAA